MAVTIETPANIGGAADASEIKVFHTTGPYQGMVLLNKANDESLVAAFDSGEILIEGETDRGIPLPPTPEYPAPMTITGLLPRAGTTSMGNVVLSFEGTNFVDGMHVRLGNIEALGVIVNSDVSINANFDLRQAPVGAQAIGIYRDHTTREPDDTTLFNVVAASTLEEPEG